MKKRLRKKRRLGEFRELGFELRVRFEQGSNQSFVDAWLDDLIERLEARRLAVMGYSDLGEFRGHVQRDGRGSVTEGERRELEAELSVRPGVAQLEVGPLVDLWHSPSDPWEPGA